MSLYYYYQEWRNLYSMKRSLHVKMVPPNGWLSLGDDIKHLKITIYYYYAI